MFYYFENPESGEQIELSFGMNDEKFYIDKEGLKWNRVYTVPQASVDTHIDPFSAKAFREKTGKNKGTMGELWARSQEMSDRRASILGGDDPVRQKAYEDYSKTRPGREHPEQKKEKANKKLKKLGFSIN